MATTVARLEAVLSADTRNFDRGMDRSQGKMRGAAKVAGVAGAAIGGVLVAGSIKAIRAASDLNEEIDKSTVVFGKASKEVLKWSGGTASSLGLSQRMALQAAGAYGNMFRTIGLGDKPAADMSKRMVTLAADMASFSNADPSDMLLRLRGGLAGEAEPLRQFGVLLSEARVKTEAYKMGLADVGDELTEQEKVQARYSLILKDSALQHGNFELTSKSLANQERILRAQIENLSAKLGTVLIPIMQRVVAHVITATEWFGKHQTAAKILVAGIGALAVALLAAAAAQLALNLAVLANPYVASAVAVAVLSAAMVVLWRRSDQAREAIKAFSPVLGPVGQTVTTFASTWNTLSAAMKRVYDYIGAIIERIKALIEWFGKLKMPKISLPNIPGFGDPGSAGGAGVRGLVPGILDELAGARSFGLSLSSGLRPGARTRHGTLSDHALGKAIDVVGSHSQKSAFFRWLIGKSDVKQAFYDPLGSIFGGVLSSYREGGHSDHVHVATYGMGGIVKGPMGAEQLALVHGGETILPTHKQNWKEIAAKFMQNLWPWAAAYFPEGASMPRTYFPKPGTDAELFVGMTTEERAGHRTMVWPKWINDWLFGGSKGDKSNAFMTILHEWAHAFQSRATIKDFRLAEGGATAFSRYVAPALASMMGLNWYSNPSLAGDPYADAFRWVRANKGMPWVLGGQFVGKVFDKGGWLMPGATLAVNNTGRPERVGGGGGDTHFHFPNYVGSKSELMAWLQNASAEFQRRNGRPLLGT